MTIIGRTTPHNIFFHYRTLQIQIAIGGAWNWNPNKIDWKIKKWNSKKQGKVTWNIATLESHIFLHKGMSIGPMKGGLSVGHRLEILRNVRRRLGNETVSVGAEVECQVSGYQIWVLVSGNINFGLNVSVGWRKWFSVRLEVDPS